MLNCVVTSSLAILSMGFQLTEDAFVDALHKGLRASSNHFGYRVWFGVNVLDDLGRHIGSICGL